MKRALLAALGIWVAVFSPILAAHVDRQSHPSISGGPFFTDTFSAAPLRVANNRPGISSRVPSELT